MLQGRSVFVVVPAFHEEAHIGRVIETMPHFVDRIIVVDDGSSDRTSERAHEASARAHAAAGGRDGADEHDRAHAGAPRTIVVRHPARRGVGAALATGYRTALEVPVAEPGSDGGQDAIAVMAGDGQMHPDDLASVVLPIVRGAAEYVKGDRFGDPGVRGMMGWPRWIGGQVFSRLTSLAVGQTITDSQCGFTAISRRALQAIDLDGLWPSFGYPNDLLGQLAARRARIHQVAVRPVYGSEISKLRPRHLPPIFFLIGRAATRPARAVTTPPASWESAEVTRTVEEDEKGVAPGWRRIMLKNARQRLRP